MYNRYIPEDASYTPVERSPQPRRERPADRPQRPPQPGRAPKNGMGSFRLPAFLSGKDGLSGLLRTLHLENVDSGDILLLLILLYLMAEGDDLELVIALGLVLVMGFFETGEQGEQGP